ncbi:hypothetical protein THIOM_004594 [Candidatus Thiomargarita nelsonii]|uniref:Uncharacterized protein n=1 Tax=Candidatus Thiomargarita nelsonii TaxID=1003181 RepID=A0A176RVG6_9GAMM|nr:hypothetical protein THIOM_004594 [Candidatus Thiomargarita nelsonii]
MYHGEVHQIRNFQHLSQLLFELESDPYASARSIPRERYPFFLAYSEPRVRSSPNFFKFINLYTFYNFTLTCHLKNTPRLNLSTFFHFSPHFKNDLKIRNALFLVHCSILALIFQITSKTHKSHFY